jgi:glycosyltransferase involved in cell wall biosynthesis
MVNARATDYGSAISHYTDSLCEALAPRPGTTVDRLQLPAWGRAAWKEAGRVVAAVQPDVVHIQYPMADFGLSPVPHLIGLRWRAIVTLHEASSPGLAVALVKCAPLTLRAPAVFVSGDYERAWVARRMPWTRKKLVVAPVGNNIGVAPDQRRSPMRVVTFGAVRPWRGLEQFMEFARLAREADLPWELRVIGDEGHQPGAFAQEMRKLGEPAGVRFTGRLSAVEAARELAGATVGYFPFPEGAAERHSSLIAALANGLPVVGTVGKRTPEPLAAVIEACRRPADALDRVRELLDDSARREALSVAGRRYAADCSWEAIAATHSAVYERLARPARRSPES